MNKAVGLPGVRALILIGGLVATVFIGIILRLVDPLSSPVIAADDPYTHMALVREHLHTGTMEPLSVGTALYPPGLHAFLAAVWVFTGADLYDIVRLGPVVFGAIGIIGMALLLWRYGGPVAALVGSLGYAVAPEVIFRTTMMSPTAQDLALLPFLFYALLRILEGHLAWTAVAAPTALFLVFAHPWLFGVLAITGAIFLALTFGLPFKTSRRNALSLRGLAVTLAIIGGSLALSLTSCGGLCGRGWRDIVSSMAGYQWTGWFLLLLSFAPLAYLMIFRRGAKATLTSYPAHRPLPLWARLAVSASIALVLGWVTSVSVTQGMPVQVDLPRMIGWPILLLAAFAVVMVPFMPSRLGHLGVALFAATYPFVIFNPLDSPFWSHRTVAFLAVGLMILAGLAAAAIARWTVRAIVHDGDVTASARSRRSRATFAAVAAGLVLVASAGTVYAATPDGYAGGWYRLYPSCEFQGLQAVASMADAAPATILIMGAPEPKMVVSGLADDAQRFWYAKTFFVDNASREKTFDAFTNKGIPLVVIIDRYAVAELREHTDFVDGTEWELIGSWCAGQATGAPRLLAYEARRPA